VEVAVMMKVVVTGSWAAAARQAQIQKTLAESLYCQCCQVYYLVQFQKQELQYISTPHMRPLIFKINT
jgi:hypothetical protein